jgi:hypothetical protein
VSFKYVAAKVLARSARVRLKEGAVYKRGGGIEKIRHRLCVECPELSDLALMRSRDSYRAFGGEPCF